VSNRYDDRKIFKNNNEVYERLLDERELKFIRHWGTPVLGAPTVKQIGELNSIQHTWKTGDRYYKLAAQYYSSPQYWWVIAQYNRKPTESHVALGDLIYIPLPLETVLGFYLR